jgi:uncharacterized membrane protein
VPIAIAIQVGGVVFLTWIGVRYSILEPAAAVGRKLALARSARVLRGHVWRLFWVSLVTALPVVFVVLVSAIPYFLSIFPIDPRVGLSLPGTGVSMVANTIHGVAYSVFGTLISCAMIASVCQTLELDPATA